MSDNSIVMLAQAGDLTNITFNWFETDLPFHRVILEQPEPRGRFVKRRIKRMGLFKVLGQIAFQLGVVPFLRRGSRERLREIKREFALVDSPIDPQRVMHVNSVNSKQTRELLAEISPAVIVVVGTRIISKRLLQAIPATFINIHCGVTPLYRGAHGAYWALVRDDRQACGVTVHYVDPGIDTGQILAQGLIQPTPRDNYYTYPYLQFAVGLPLLKQAAREALNGPPTPKPAPPGESALWSHPTIFEYIFNRVRRGVG